MEAVMAVTSSETIIRVLLDLSFNPRLGLSLPNPGSVTGGNVQPFKADLRLLFGGDEAAEPKGRWKPDASWLGLDQRALQDAFRG
jgi:hypothetical protein